jgi:hypothetical protein
LHAASWVAQRTLDRSLLFAECPQPHKDADWEHSKLGLKSESPSAGYLQHSARPHTQQVKALACAAAVPGI